MNRKGDFTGLAHDYHLNRPGYSDAVLSSLLGLLEQPVTGIDFADIGAGTGIWTRMVAERRPHSITAVEPNADMRSVGQSGVEGDEVIWLEGSAEDTGLSSSSVDWLTMASSFHWADTAVALREFHRVLRPHGLFTALWNPRRIAGNPILEEIEAKIHALKPDLVRVSSGLSGITKVLQDLLVESRLFENIVYMEARHSLVMTPERYIGAWRSVNDLRVQLGPEAFDEFLGFVMRSTRSETCIETEYVTRAWSARSTKTATSVNAD